MSSGDQERVKAQILAAADVLKTASATMLSVGILLPLALDTLSYRLLGVALIVAIVLFIVAELAILEAYRRRE